MTAFAGSPFPYSARPRPKCTFATSGLRGESLHSDIVTDHMRMQTALESAGHDLEKGDLASARTDIDLANEYARCLMKIVER